ncbi:MAG: TIM barrel protein [Mariniblastus sp.]|nr:TIM barrel protein [Mariniblastus sp.]
MHRRAVLKYAAAISGALVVKPTSLFGRKLNSINDATWNPSRDPWLKISVQQYTFNRQLRSGELKIEDFPQTVVGKTGIKALEYFNGHMEDKSGDERFFRELRKRSDDLGAVNTLMLCRSSNALDSPNAGVRKKAVEGYRPWLQATKILGGQFIRVDTRKKGDADEQKKYAVAGLRSLCAVADEYKLGILVENHGGHSGNGAWLADVMRQVDLKNCGTLPDFQNFTDYDPYQGVAEMMPTAKVLCAKAKAFDKEGNESNVDFRRMLKIARDAGFKGYIGIEFEGHELGPIEGIKATQRLIEKVILELG